MSFNKSKKLSAFQVYSEEQVQSRRGRTYRTVSPRSRADSFGSPTRRSGSRERHLDLGMDHHPHGRRRGSDDIVDIRFRAGAEYRQRQDSVSPDRASRRFADDPYYDRRGSGDRFRDGDRYSDRGWDDRSRPLDCSSGRDHRGGQMEDDYLIVDMKDGDKSLRNSHKYSDSDDDCLHESLRRSKHNPSYSSEDERPMWGSDRFDDDADNYRQDKKRRFSDQHRSSLSPPPKLRRRNSGERDHTALSDSGKFLDRDRPTAPDNATKKKKGKGKRNLKMKDKKRAVLEKRDVTVVGSRGKIPSLLDLEFPPGLAARNLEPSSSEILPSFNSKISSFGYGNRRSDSNCKNLPRLETCNEVNSGHQDSYPRDSRFRRHSSEDDCPRHASGDFERSGHHSSDFDRYYDDPDGPRRMSYATDYRGNDLDRGSSSRRNRQNSSDYRLQRERSPDARTYSDSEQDSDREGTRRSWREERRERQPKRRDSKDDRRSHKSRDTYSFSSRPAAKKLKESESSTGREKGFTKKEKEKRRESDITLDPASRFQVLHCSEGLAVFLTHPQEICLRGRTRLQVMAGGVSVMGYKISANSTKSYALYSPTSASLLTIKTCSAETDKKVLRKVLKSLDVDEASIKEFMTGVVILRVRHLPFPAADYICTLPPYTQLFKINMERCAMTSGAVSQEMVKLGAAFFPVNQAPNLPLRWSSDMDSAMEKWTAQVKKSGGSSVAVLCGGVNSGKSTFSRYMVNAALNIVSKVCYLNCDVGQTEFSPPGSVSLTVLEEPVLGPPFCHQKATERMCFFGLTSPADGPTHYVQCLQYVWQAYEKLDSRPPLVVNTMGWNEGLGLKLFVDVLRLTSPDIVIQFNSSNPTLNFPAITTGFLLQESGWLYSAEPGKEEERGKDPKKHELITVDSLVNNRIDGNKIKLTPRNLRDLALLAHLMEGCHPTVTLTSAVPYTVAWSKLAVHVCHSQVPHRLIWAALNASVVALCNADLSEAKRTSENSPLFFDETPVCDCLGYGLVRAVDTERHLVYIITALPRTHLAKVNCLLKGAVNIPDQLFLKQTSLDEVPYVDALAPATALGPLKPRSRMPRRTGTATT